MQRASRPYYGWTIIMADKKVSDSLLVAYADGELGPEDRVLVESAMVADSSLKTRVEKYKQSGDLLKDSFDIDNATTPDHIVHRIREIEAAAVKKRQAGPAGGNDQSSWWSIPLFGRSLAASFSLRSLTSLGGSFVAGLACAVFVISPSLPTTGTNFSQLVPRDDVVQMVMRGAAQEKLPYIRQQDQNISSGGSVMVNEQFSIMYNSPIQGSVEIFEVTVEKNPAVQAVLSFFRLNVDKLLPRDIAIEADQLTNLGSFVVDDQDSLRLRIEVSNNATTIRHDVSFKVVEP